MSDDRVNWPQGWDRTPRAEREPNRSFEVTLAQAFDDLERTLDLLDVDNYRWDFDADQRKRDNRPYSRANPDDPGFVLRWTMEGNQHAVACDEYDSLRDNVRTVGHYLEEKRKMGNRPVQTGEDEFANARLPPADEDDVIVAGGTHSTDPPHEVLGVAPDAPRDVVKAAARQLQADAHPDSGGSTEAFQRITEAKEAMLDD